jgi:hypothetical protein
VLTSGRTHDPTDNTLIGRPVTSHDATPTSLTTAASNVNSTGPSRGSAFAPRTAGNSKAHVCQAYAITAPTSLRGAVFLQTRTSSRMSRG